MLNKLVKKSRLNYLLKFFNFKSLRERYRYMRALPRIEKNQTRLLTPSSSPYNDRFEPVSIARQFLLRYILNIIILNIFI